MIGDVEERQVISDEIASRAGIMHYFSRMGEVRVLTPCAGRRRRLGDATASTGMGSPTSLPLRAGKKPQRALFQGFATPLAFTAQADGDGYRIPNYRARGIRRRRRRTPRVDVAGHSFFRLRPLGYSRRHLACENADTTMKLAWPPPPSWRHRR